MATIVSIQNLKGGSGKTTTAQHISITQACKGHKVLFIDTDEQQTAHDFFELNETHFPNGYDGVIDYAYSEVEDLEGLLNDHSEDYDFIYIDTPPSFSSNIRTIVNLSDLVLITCQPKDKDIKATVKFIEMVKMYNPKKVRILITRKPHNIPDLKARTRLLELGYPILETSVRQYTAYEEADELGKCIIHLDSKNSINAATDIHNLSAELERV